ncbi:MAG: hypothetical protein J6X43_02180, partial [Bacteroidales bacterium]|nr:hypothetical protein [Bacteroidales bacterium]
MNRFKIITLIGVIFCVSITSFAQVLDQIIVVVGDDMIKQSDVENQQMLLQQQGETATKCEIFKEMVVQKFLVDQAKIDSVEVSDGEVNNEIDRRVSMISGTKGGLAQLEKFYGKSEVEIRSDWKPVVKEQLLAQKVQNTIVCDVSDSPNDVRWFYQSHLDS